MGYYLLGRTAHDGVGVDELVHGPDDLDIGALLAEFTAVYDHGAKRAMTAWYRDHPRPREEEWDMSSERQEIAAWRVQQGWDPGSVYRSFVTWLLQEHGCYRVRYQWVALDQT